MVIRNRLDSVTGLELSRQHRVASSVIRFGAPGIRVTREYWYVHNRSTGCPKNIICAQNVSREWESIDKLT